MNNTDKTLEQYINDYCQTLDVKFTEITSSKRTRHLADCRAILGYILITKFHISLTNAGKILNRHHSSVIHYRKLVPETAKYDIVFKEMLDKATSLHKSYQDSGVRFQGLQDRFLISNKELRNKLLKLREEMNIDRVTIIKLQEKIESLEQELRCVKYNYV